MNMLDTPLGQGEAIIATQTVAPATTARRRRGRIDIVGPLLVFAAFIGIWYLMHHWALRAIWDKPNFLVPTPHDVVRTAFFTNENRATLVGGLRVTATVAFLGLAIAIVVGIGLATLMARRQWLERSMWPYLVALQAIPILALVPLIGSIWGYGLSARTLVCVIISLFPIVANTLFGLLSADKGQHDLFTLRGVSPSTRLWKLQFPAALPAIFAGFRIAAGLSVIGAIVGELFFKRGDKGIGILLDTFRNRNNYPMAYGALIVAALLGIVVFVIFGLISRLVVGKWHESTRS